MAALPYPPADNVLRDLAFEVEVAEDGTARAWMPVTPYVTAVTGGVAAGILATFVDSVTGNLASRAARPDRAATADIALTIVAPPTGTEVGAAASVVRRGRTTAVVEVRMGDAARATATFSILPKRDDNPGPPLSATGRRAVLGGGGHGLTQWVGDAVGLTVLDTARGELTVPLSAYVANSFGALQGGMVALLAEQAGAAAVGAALGAPAATEELHIAYLSQCRHGPFTTGATVLGGGSAIVEVLDASGRRVAVAQVAAAVAP